MTSFEKFESQVIALCANINAISRKDASAGAHDFVIDSINYPIDVCEAAAILTGVCASKVKFFNKKFRDGITRAYFEKAVGEIRGAS